MRRPDHAAAASWSPRARPALVALLPDRNAGFGGLLTGKEAGALAEILACADPAATESIARTTWWVLAGENDALFTVFARAVARLTYWRVEALSGENAAVGKPAVLQ